MFIQKYKPTTSLQAFFDRKERLYQIPSGYRELFFPSARMGLACYLTNMKRLFKEKHKVIVTSYICSAVIDVLHHLEFDIRYVDLAPNSLFPDIEFLQSMNDNKTLAVILAPYFGLYPRTLPDVKRFLGDTLFILDFAQCLGCPFEAVDADAVILSFGLGKGIDYYGGSLLYKPFMQSEISSLDEEHFLRFAFTTIDRFSKALVVKNKTFYRILKSLIDRKIEENKKADTREKYRALSIFAVRLILKMQKKFRPMIQLSRIRAKELYNERSLKDLLINKSLFDIDLSTFLRFPLLPKNLEERDNMLDFFLAKGIELTRADEKIYDNSLENFNSFNERILKLPFLGTLKTREFQYLKRVVEKYGKQRK